MAKWVVRALASLPLVGAGACDPSWHMAIRQPVAPTTAAQCIEGVLRADPRVDSVTAAAGGGLDFALRDSTVPGGRRHGWVRLERSADTVRTLELAVLWHFPAGGVGADSARTRQLAAFGRETAERIRLTCARDVPSAVSCRIVGPPLIGGRRDCEPAA